MAVRDQLPLKQGLRLYFVSCDIRVISGQRSTSINPYGLASPRKD